MNSKRNDKKNETPSLINFCRENTELLKREKIKREAKKKVKYRYLSNIKNRLKKRMENITNCNHSLLIKKNCKG